MGCRSSKTQTSEEPTESPPRLTKRIATANTESVQPSPAPIPQPPKFRSRSSGVSSVQDDLQPAFGEDVIRPARPTSIFGPFDQDGPHQSPALDVCEQDVPESGWHHYPRIFGGDGITSGEPHSTSSGTYDCPGSGLHHTLGPGAHPSSGCAGGDGGA
ncbi:hypothetical protein BDW02DRAFT_644838 [Decorospora gaudefroyi]|uniref:Uncharacterized protein n=1 Tax=Decorospora gaudefroyi TaxID=184978 RepID=A0A6A5KPT6_9PLEO|nr:hypothetical protein BDW02DRAFT_644838 [Decorospora gaudefroyi]